MKTLRIPKGNGRYREVVVPSWRRKRQCRDELPRLMAQAMLLDVRGVQHGFVPGRSPVTNASVHVGYAHTLTLDLTDCFNHVTEDRLRAAGIEPPPCVLVDGIARQGLPTSPAAANIALAPLDAAIVAWLAGRGVYTRYADDLTISSDDRSVIDEARSVVPQILERHGFSVARGKTHLQTARAGRRQITGVSVGAAPGDLRAPREFRRRLRAAAHRLATMLRDLARMPDPPLGACLAAVMQAHAVRGMHEWAQMRAPDPHRAALDWARRGEIELARLIVARGMP